MVQTWKYADRCCADEVHLIVFDREVGRSWDEKVFHEMRMYEGYGERAVQYPITIWGM